MHSGPEAERHAFDAASRPHDLADTYLPQFEAAVRQGRVASVMAAYNRVNGQPCAASPWLLGDVLRTPGASTATWSATAARSATSSPATTRRPRREAAAASALRAGTDLDCGARLRARCGGALAQGLVAEADLDRALVRLFSARIRLGMFDPPASVPWAGLGAETVDAPAHRQLAREAAQKSIVLLENRGVLPLAGSVRRLAVVGPTADDREVLLGDYAGTPVPPGHAAGRHPVGGEGARDLRRGTRGAPPWPGRAARARRFADALVAARRSDVVIAVLGLDPRLEAEEGDSALNPAGDRRDLGLPGAQQRLLEALIATGKPVVVVLTGGSALAVPFASAHAAAVLEAWYPGEAGGDAVADVLFGEVSPAGRLPVTFYRAAADLPPFEDYASAAGPIGIWNGRRCIPSGSV